MPRHLRHLAFALIAVLSAPPACAASLEQDVLSEINYVRTHPREYAEELRSYRDGFEGRMIHDEAGRHMTFEGVRAVDDAIRFLDRQRPVAPLRYGDLLGRAALDHAIEHGRRGTMGHISANGMTPARRVVRRGGGAYVSETIAYGYSDPKGVVRNLIVDDGVPSRAHRSVIFLSFLRYAGVGCAPHSATGYACVIDYSATSDGAPAAPANLARSEATEDVDRQPF